MAREALISTLTMYHCDDTLFDGLQVPSYNFPRSRVYDDLFLEQGWTLDRQTLIDNLLFETCELEVLYTNPETLKYAIGAWCRKEFPVWQSLYETLFYRYNPIWNKDGTLKETAQGVREKIAEDQRQHQSNSVNTGTEAETIGDTDNTERKSSRTDSETNTRTGTETGTETGTGSDTGSETETGNAVKASSRNESKSGENITQVSAYDQTSAWSNRDKVTDTNQDAETVSETDTDSRSKQHTTTTGTTNNRNTAKNENEVNIGSGSESEENNRSYNRNRSGSNNNVMTGSENEQGKGTENETNNNTIIRQEYGNIGVTMTQQLIEAERNLVKFNLYDLIIDSFKARFCLLVY